MQVSVQNAADAADAQTARRMSAGRSGGEAWLRSTIGFKKPRLQPVGSARADADELLAQ